MGTDAVVIFNGLGNQMSQYAFFLKKKSINKKTYFFSYAGDHNGLELNKVFGINCEESFKQKQLKLLFQLLLTIKLKIVMRPVKALLKVFNCRVVREDFNYSFNSQYLIPSSGITIYYGGWPSEKYFIDIRGLLLKTFTFNKPSDQENERLISLINQTNSVAIHVRRGDYLNNDNINLFGKVCTLGYYKAAIELITAKVPDLRFFVFSNDFEWIKENFDTNNFIFVTENQKEDSWKDMYLMSICKHNIIANSSFSWWGAWLNQNPGKIVISPKRYLNNDIETDFYPEPWIKLSEY